MISRDDEDKFNRRNDLLNRIFSTRMNNSLESLLQAMNQNDEFASMWFCGSRIDHSRCLASKAIGWGISALPNDSVKAGLPKYHPHQLEIIIPIDGLVCIETYTPQQGFNITSLEQGERDYMAIGKWICHRVTQEVDTVDDAAFFYVKTNVGQEPQEIGVLNHRLEEACLGCRYHSDNSQCQMFQHYQESP